MALEQVEMSTLKRSAPTLTLNRAKLRDYDSNDCLERIPSSPSSIDFYRNPRAEPDSECSGASLQTTTTRRVHRFFFGAFAVTNILATLTLSPSLLISIWRGRPFWELFDGHEHSWCKLQTFVFCFHKNLCFLVSICLVTVFNPEDDLRLERPTSHWRSKHPLNFFLCYGISFVWAAIECQCYVYINPLRQCVCVINFLGSTVAEVQFGIIVLSVFGCFIVFIGTEVRDRSKPVYKLVIVMICMCPWYNFLYVAIVNTPMGNDLKPEGLLGPAAMLLGHLSTFLTTIGVRLILDLNSKDCGGEMPTRLQRLRAQYARTSRNPTKMASGASTSLHHPSANEIDWEQMSFSKTLNKSLLTVKQADGISYRIYRLIRAYRETHHFRCSTCDRLNAKKNTRYMPKVRTKFGKLVGDPFPEHNPECLPLSVEEYGLRQIDRLCRWYIKEKHVPPKAAWELGRKYCRQYAERHNLNPQEFVLCFPEFERIKGTYLRIYQQSGGLPSNNTDDLTTMTIDVTADDSESLDFLYAADREQHEPLPNETIEEIDETQLSAHDIRRKIDQLTSVKELPRDSEGRIIYTVPYEELCSRVVCVEGGDEVKLFFSKRCRPQITFRGHVYYLYTEKTIQDADHKRWHCIEPRCHGYIITADEHCSKIVDNNVCHLPSCVPDVDKTEMKVRMYDLRLMAEFTVCSPQQLFSDFCEDLMRDSPQLVPLLPSVENMPRMLEQHRQQFLIRTRFEFEYLNRLARHEHEENVKSAFLFAKGKRMNRVFPKTLCMWCGVQIGEEREAVDRKKANQERRFAQESLIEHVNSEHGGDLSTETVVFPKLSQFKNYLRELALKKHKFVRKGYFAGGTYYLCQCDERVHRTSGVHCTAYAKVLSRDDWNLKEGDEVAVGLCLTHMFHEEVEGTEEPPKPGEFLQALKEEPGEEDGDYNQEEMKVEEPASKRPRRSTAGQSKHLREEQELPSPQTAPVARNRRTRPVRKVAQVNYAVVEQLEDFEAHVVTLRDCVKSLKNPDEIARISAKLQELEDEITGEEKYKPPSQNRQFIAHEDPGPSNPPAVMPVPVTLPPPRTTVTVIRSAVQRIAIQPQVDIQQVDVVNHVSEITPVGVSSGSPFKFAIRNPDGSLRFLTKSSSAQKVTKRLLRLAPIQTSHNQERVVHVAEMSPDEQNQSIDVD